jgi:hypothetical protein
LFAAEGDLLYALAAGVSQKLSIGSEGVVLGVKDGVPNWRGVIANRQGGSETNWAAVGTNNYVPPKSIVQVGRFYYSGDASQSGLAVITFPQPFSNFPIVFAAGCGAAASAIAGFRSIPTTTGVSIAWKTVDESLTGAVEIAWLAIGPIE